MNTARTSAPHEYVRHRTNCGHKLIVSITSSDGEGSYTLSTVKVERPKDWSALEKAFAEQRPIAGMVTEFVKGGLCVDAGVPAFLPASRSGAKDQAEIEKLVGQNIQCKIIKLDTTEEDRHSIKCATYLRAPQSRSFFQEMC